MIVKIFAKIMMNLSGDILFQSYEDGEKVKAEKLYSVYVERCYY